MIAGVPYDAEVEYLASTGTQYIDTGIIPTTNLEFELHCRFSVLFTAGGHVPMGFRYQQGTQWRYWVTNFQIFDNPPQSYASFFNDKRCRAAKQGHLEYTFSLKNGIWSNGIGDTQTINLNQTPPIEPIPQSWTIYLFKGNENNESVDPFTGRIYHVKFWKSGVLVRDFIPVRVGNVGYMYDRVSRKLFGNAGTGAFVLGPDVATPVMGLRRYPQIGGAA